METKLNPYRLTLIPCLFLLSTEVYAYIDPGTGSLLLQGLIAGLAAAAYTLKLYWYKFKSFFSRDKDKGEELEEE